MSEIELHHEHVMDSTSRTVGVLVALVGVLLSVVTILSHRAHTQAVIERTEANDLWGYYQAKKIREQASEVGISVLNGLGAESRTSQAQAQKLGGARDHYSEDAKKLQKQAEQKDRDTKVSEERALRYDLGEGMLELGLVLCSLFFLSRKIFFPILGVVSAALGTLVGASGFLL